MPDEKWIQIGNFIILTSEDTTQGDSDLDMVERKKPITTTLPHHRHDAPEPSASDSEEESPPLPTPQAEPKLIGPFRCERTADFGWGTRQLEEEQLKFQLARLYGEDALKTMPKPSWIIADAKTTEAHFYQKYLDSGYRVCECKICQCLELPFLIKKGHQWKDFENYHIKYFHQLNKLFDFKQVKGMYMNYLFVFWEKVPQ